MVSESKEFKKFFKPYAKNIDEVNQLAFWKLNNGIIMEIIKHHIPRTSAKNKIVLDAGGGTGRWICDLSKIYRTKFILYDLSEDMIRKAEDNFDQEKIEERVEIIRGDLTDMKKIKSSSIDYILSIYNPISFIQKKEKAIMEFYRILKNGGKILLMGQGFYNAIFSKITNFTAPAKELEWMERSSKVRWGKHVQPLNTFSRESLENLLRKEGFQIVGSYGIPIFVQPGAEDFTENSGESRISQALRRNKSFYQEVLRLEMKYNFRPDLINRGMNILMAAQKNSK